MSQPWIHLDTRYGGGGTQPSAEQLQAAADELYVENVAGMSEADYAEHPNAWLRYGTDDGPMYVIDAYRTGTVVLSKHNDQDDDEPAKETTLTGVSRERLVELWSALARGDLIGIRETCPECGW